MSLRNTLTLLLALILLANGLLMLAAPEFWYHLIPGVPDTGRSTRTSYATSVAPIWSVAAPSCGCCVTHRRALRRSSPRSS